MKSALRVLFWVAASLMLAWIAELIGGPGAGGTTLLVMGVILAAYYGVEMSRHYSARVEQAHQDLTAVSHDLGGKSRRIKPSQWFWITLTYSCSVPSAPKPAQDMGASTEHRRHSE